MIALLTLWAVVCTVLCALAIKKANTIISEARAILQDIEDNRALLIAVAKRDARRSKFRRLNQ